MHSQLHVIQNLWQIVSNDAVSQGVVVIAASGNDGFVNAISSPACASGVISVGAVDKDDSRTIYSNESNELDIVAPGTGITSTVPSNSCQLCDSSGFIGLSGTSMAAPHVSGVAALLLDADPTLTPSEVRKILKDSSFDLGDNGFDSIFGSGRVDAFSAYSPLATLVAPVMVDDLSTPDMYKKMIMVPEGAPGSYSDIPESLIEDGRGFKFLPSRRWNQN